MNKPHSIQLGDRLKTCFGSFPITNAQVASDRQGFEFTFADFEVAANKEPPHIALEDFASALPIRIDKSDSIKQAQLRGRRLLDLARTCGPIFGNSSKESANSWLEAVTSAQIALTLQEFINGEQGKSKLVEDRVLKSSISYAQSSDPLFSLYVLSFQLTNGDDDEYATLLPNEPQLHVFNSSKSNDYVFIAPPAGSQQPECQVRTFDIALISTSGQLPNEAFTLLVDYFNENESTEGQLIAAARNAGMSIDAGSIRNLRNNRSLTTSVQPITEGDKQQLQHLVYALISIHLQDVTIDLFRAADETGFLLFNTFLSYLWYGFAKNLGAVKVGYCPVCGKGFALTKHRGPEKKYCSDKCRTIAKNAKTAEHRELLRNRFLQGESVAEIARKLPNVHNESMAIDQVVRNLKSWKQLTNIIRQEFANSGSSELAQRSLQEGILSKNRIEKIEKEALKGRQIADRNKQLTRQPHPNT
ncbi:MAG: hypothetical protein PUE02_04125 [Eggerthellaceae bacterium]|nr:hypothetical protein [Eggerthellaceae bacterium]